MKTILHFTVSAVAILITAYILPGVAISGFLAAFVLAVVLGVINLTIRPILVMLTLPVTIFSLGLFLLFINGILIMLASYIVSGFSVNNLWWALLFGIVLAIVNSVFESFEKK